MHFRTIPLTLFAVISMSLGVPMADTMAAQKRAAKSAPGTGASTSVTATSAKTFTDPTTGMEFVFVKGGCYKMGDNFGDGRADEKPVHEVCVDDFYMGKYEVTQAQWVKVMGDNPSNFIECGASCPVENVSWEDVQEYAEKLTTQSGKTYRLPYEAEWEFAARSGGKKEQWSGTSDLEGLGARAWFTDNSGKTTHPVGTKLPNGLGLYDMSGNVWEWCKDWYDAKYYEKSPVKNPRGALSGSYRILRGGSWFYDGGVVRAAGRVGVSPDARGISVGFRLVLPAQ